MPGIIPIPVSVEADPSSPFAVTAATVIQVPEASPTATRIGELMAARLRRATGLALPVTHGAQTNDAAAGAISLNLDRRDTALGDEGYRLTVDRSRVVIEAAAPAGLFHATTTIRQLLPAGFEASTRHPGPWLIPGGRIVDHPRYGWRGAMLDVARHFFSVADVERYIDEISLYKINVLHLHLSDDQGWRIAIDAWPRLTSHGGSTAVNGDPGGFYTKDDYREIVAFAADRYITIVPEIDVPGHVNAALASYPELNCDGKERPLYTGIEVGFSSLCVAKGVTWRFLDDVVEEVAALTPGAYFHIGGDETTSTPPEDYLAFIERVQAIVEAHGKKVVGWAELSKARLRPGALAQYWDVNDGGASAKAAADQGVGVIASPANHSYLDMQYDASTPLGLHWAGYVNVESAYSWDPAELGYVSAKAVTGVEAPIWTETLRFIGDVELMAFPRLAGIAEVGWSPRQARDWAGYRSRLALQAPRWAAMGVNFYRSPEIDWSA